MMILNKRTPLKFPFIVMGLFLTILFLVIVLVLDGRDEGQGLNWRSSTVLVEEKNDVIPLELPSGFVWKEEAEGSERIDYLVWWDVRTGEKGKLRLPGREWVAWQTVNNEKELFQKTAYNDIKHKLTIEAGWKETFSSTDLKMSNLGFEANGLRVYGIYSSPVSIGVTFVKSDNSQYRTVSLREYSDKKFILPGRGSVDYVYPHKREYRIFISDLIVEKSLNDLKKKPLNESEWMQE